MIEQTGVGGQVGARRAADRFLVYLHQPLDVLKACADAARAHLLWLIFQVRLLGILWSLGVAQVCAHQFQQGLADQARFAGARDAGHRREAAQRERCAEVVEVVTGYAFQV